MEGKDLEFKKRLEQTLANEMPKPEDIKLSELTGRIILSAEKYQKLQVLYTYGDYNKWCTGVNKHVDPNSDPIIPLENYIETGDAKSFSDFFITECEARLEAKEAEQAKNQPAEHQTT